LDLKFQKIFAKPDRIIRDFLLFIFDLLKYLPYKFIQPVHVPQGEPQKDIFIIKTDEIGDYVLFRNFLPFIKNNKRYGNYKIILCGNNIFKNLAENLDKDYVDEFIWLNKKKFINNLRYRNDQLKFLSSRNPEILVNCCYSRSFYIDDEIALKVPASKKIAFKTDLSNSYKWQIKLSNKYYSNLIDINGEVFDFKKNRSFLEKLFNIKIDLSRPEISINKLPDAQGQNKNYAVLYAGGKRNYKKWDLNYFIKIGDFIVEKYDLNIFLVGTESEAKDNLEIYSGIKNKNKVTDLTGKTSLISLTSLISKAKLLIANDSGIVHLAASVKTKTIVILNGTQFGRFLPYPADTCIEISALYPAEIMKNINDKNSLYEKFKYRSTLDINSVLPEQVENEIDKVISK
jgi:ADP-heptose:LPS heptosyltransferase